MIVTYKQQLECSCAAAVFQMMIRNLLHRHVSHAAAVRATGCKVDGTYMTWLIHALRNCGLHIRSIKPNTKQIRKALAAGKLIIVDDVEFYHGGHVLVVFSATAQGFYVADPATGKPAWRPCRTVVRAAQWCLLVS